MLKMLKLMLGCAGPSQIKDAFLFASDMAFNADGDLLGMPYGNDQYLLFYHDKNAIPPVWSIYAFSYKWDNIAYQLFPDGGILKCKYNKMMNYISWDFCADVYCMPNSKIKIKNIKNIFELLRDKNDKAK